MESDCCWGRRRASTLVFHWADNWAAWQDGKAADQWVAAMAVLLVRRLAEKKVPTKAATSAFLLGKARVGHLVGRLGELVVD